MFLAGLQHKMRIRKNWNSELTFDFLIYASWVIFIMFSKSLELHRWTSRIWSSLAKATTACPFAFFDRCGICGRIHQNGCYRCDRIVPGKFSKVSKMTSDGEKLIFKLSNIVRHLFKKDSIGPTLERVSNGSDPLHSRILSTFRKTSHFTSFINAKWRCRWIICNSNANTVFT